MTALADAAVRYAELGFAVFRLSAREKIPLAGTRGFKDAVRDPGKVTAWWRGAGATLNIGLATGAASGVWVLDLDGPEAEASIRALEARHGALPQTVEQVTGGGRHLLFAWDPARPVRNMCRRSREVLGPGVDVRGDGGYIVAAPSIHPSGRAYAWAFSRAPGEIAPAQAPGWLMDLVEVEPERPAAPPRPAPVTARDGRASAYGEAVLAGAVREVAATPPGAQNDTLYRKAVLVGCFCAGGEMERGYARDALIAAGLAMQAHGKRHTAAAMADIVDRAMTWAEAHPRGAPELSDVSRAAANRAERSADRLGVGQAAVIAEQMSASRRVWKAARPATVRGAADWLRSLGVEPYALPDLLAQRIRVDAGLPGPSLLLPLRADLDDAEPDGLLQIPLAGDWEDFAPFVGESLGRVCELHRPDAPEGVLVAIDVADALTLGAAARAEGWPLRVVLAPRLSTFAGGALGDRWGRIDPDTPQADPARRPWTLTGVGDLPVQLAVRRDLSSPVLRVRKAEGGTRELRLHGDAAARFYGGLTEQHWRAAGANAVRVLRPTRGVGFSADA